MKSINELASELRPFRPMEKLPVFFLKWTALSLAVIGIAYAILPLKPDLGEVAKDSIFHVENVMWLLLSVTSGLAMYDSAFPDNRRQTFGYISVFTIAFLFSLTFYHNGYQISLHEAGEEMSLWKGRCGFIITILAILENGGLYWWAKNGASSIPNTTAFWAAMSSSALACLLMQVVCLHDNSLHLIIWHFLPLGAICFASQKILGKKLAW